MCDNLEFDDCDVSTDVDFEDLSDSSFDTTNDLITDDISDDSFDLSDDFEMEDISDDSLDMTDDFEMEDISEESLDVSDDLVMEDISDDSFDTTDDFEIEDISDGSFDISDDLPIEDISDNSLDITDDFEMEDISDESFDVSDDLVMEDISDDSFEAADDFDIEDISDESFDVDTSFEASDFSDDFDNNNFGIDDVSDDDSANDYFDEVEFDSENVGEDDVETLEFRDDFSAENEGFDAAENSDISEENLCEDIETLELNDELSDEFDEIEFDDSVEALEPDESSADEAFNVTESVDNTNLEIDDLDTDDMFEENEVNDDEFAEFEGTEEQLEGYANSNEYTEMSDDEMIDTEESSGYPINEIETTDEFNINDIEQALTNHEVYNAPLTTEEYSDDSALEEISEHETPSMTDEELDAFVDWENEHNNGYYDIINDIMNNDSLTAEQKDAMITPLQEELNSLENETVEYGARVKGLTYDGRDIITSSPDEEYGNELPLDENLNIDLEGDLTEEELNSVYEGLESFDFQGVNALEDTERLDENLENFTNENWENFSIEEQKESMNDLAQYIIDVTGLENPPKIEFYNNDKEGDYGGFDRLNNTLSINEHMLYQNDEAADTVAHELWHALQYQRASNPQTRQDLMYAENFSNYISPSEDFEAYQSQILESEARAFAQQIKDRLASYSK